MVSRIAIVGTGIAGLTAAYLLSRRYPVVVFEANDYIGGHSHTVQVDGADGPLGVDTGFIVYNQRTYPNFCRLLDQLDVLTQASDMSFSFRNQATGREYGVPELGKLFAQPSNLVSPRFWNMLRQIMRFYKEAPLFLSAAEQDVDLELEAYLDQQGYGDAFKDDHLFPMAESIWSGSRQQLGAFPARAFLQFFLNHGLLSLKDRPRWRTITGGSVNYVKRLVEPFRETIRLQTPVTRIRRDDQGVEVSTPAGPPERFDKIVLACHADQALAMLESPTELERDIVGSFPYAPNDVVLHSDPSVMPRRKKAWASWNYLRSGRLDQPVALTYDMNRLQGLPGDEPFLVTLNRPDDPASSLVHGRFTYDHPQFDTRGMQQQLRHDELNGLNNTFYCGAYWGYGFHEDGVASALRVARHFGEEL